MASSNMPSRWWLLALLTWNLFWALSAGSLLLLATELVSLLPLEDSLYRLLPEALLRAAALGGIGGALSSFYRAWQLRNPETPADDSFELHLLVKPILGLTVGALIYLVVFLPALWLGGTRNEGVVVFQSLVLPLALLGGFFEARIWAYVNRFMQGVLGPAV